MYWNKLCFVAVDFEKSEVRSQITAAVRGER